MTRINSSLSYQERIREKLTAALQPVVLDIKDDSARHAGHSGHDPRGETHFIVHAVSSIFQGKGLVERHRLVYQVLADELNERVHALNLSLKTPEEIQASS